MDKPIWEVKARNGRWAVQRRGTERADSIHASRDDAIARGKDLASRYAGRLRIRSRTGVCESDESFATADDETGRADSLLGEATTA